MMRTIGRSRIFLIIKILLVIEWLHIWEASDVMPIYHLFLGLAGIGAMFMQRDTQKLNKREKRGIACLAALFSLAVCLADYAIIRTPVRSAIALYTSYEIGVSIMKLLYSGMTIEKQTEPAHTRHPSRVFLAVFFGAVGVDVLQFIRFDYPGVLTPDSFSQIEQILSGTYQDHHPYLHTMLMGLFIRLGLRLFGEINAAVAFYSVAQIVMMALCFAYAVTTLYQAGINWKHLILPAAAYIFLPYHIKYSFTLWKDVLFGGVMLVLVVALYRLFRKIGNENINTAVLGVGLLGSMVLRNNGFLALAAAFVLCLYFLIRNKHRRIIVMFVLTLAAAWLLKGPVRNALHIESGNFKESLSIPIQQIARVVARDGELTQEQEALLATVVELDSVKEKYLPYLADPVKSLVDGEYIREHKGDFLKAWIQIGLQNPGIYMDAWIEQTKGYWNGAYDYWIWVSYISTNAHGIEKRVEESNDPLYYYFDTPYSLRLLYGVGIHVWLLLCLIAFHLLRGDYRKAMLGIPTLMMVGTLLVASPVYCEFRYAYAVFTVLPFYAALSFGKYADGRQAAAPDSDS